jgi:hypothetical protein
MAFKPYYHNVGISGRTWGGVAVYNIGVFRPPHLSVVAPALPKNNVGVYPN